MDKEKDIIINWQDGPIKENGVNGVQIDDVIKVLTDRLFMLNREHPSKENLNTLTHLQKASYWQAKRTLDRTKRGVEGTNAQ